MVDLRQLGLSEEALAQRVRSIGGSDANIIMSGDEDKIRHLWEIKTRRAPPDDLSDELYVLMGQFTEPLNIAWFERRTGLQVKNQQEVVICDDAWRKATLDGIVMRLEEEDIGLGPMWYFDGIFESKHVNSFRKNEEILASYQPQLHHNMDVANLEKAHLSVFKGNGDWLHWEVEYDEAYGAQVRQAEWEFWMAVHGDEPPTPYLAPDAPKGKGVREVSMQGSNTWAAWAVEYLDTKQAHKDHDAAKEALKAMIAPDVTRTYGHGIEGKRDARGGVRFYILPEKEPE